MLKLMFKLVLVVGLLGGGYLVYTFWDDLTPGERYHLVDKARAGDVDGLVDSAKFKADEHLDTQKRKAAESLKEISGKAVDAAARETKSAVNEKIDQELKAKALDQAAAEGAAAAKGDAKASAKK